MHIVVVIPVCCMLSFGITQKKAYNIQSTAKVEIISVCWNVCMFQAEEKRTDIHTMLRHAEQIRMTIL